MSTLGRALLQTSSRYAHRTAIIDHEGTFTWAEFCTRVARVASILANLGIAPGQRFGILSANSFRQAELIYAGYWSGTTAVPINSRLAPDEIRAVLHDANCRLLAVDAMGEDLVRSKELAEWRDSLLSLEPASYEKLVAKAERSPLAETDSSSEALVLYTSGTTGRTKGVALTHGNILSNALQVSFVWPGTADDVVLHVAPMFHSADLVMTGMMLCGAAHAFLPRFNPKELLSTMEEFHVTVTMMVPAMLMMTTQSQAAEEFDLASLRGILYGASSMSRSALEDAMRFFPHVEFTQGYGLTETSPLLTMLDHKSHMEAFSEPDSARVRSCGHVLPAIDLRLVDENGTDVATGSEGEIAVRGPNVFSGYLNSDDINATVISDGWFLTGDIGSVDKDGYLYIMDRKKDVINVGGESVSSVEVEAVLNRHPDIIEAAAIGIPSARLGEQIFAVVVCCSGITLTEREIHDFCHNRIGNFKIPSGVACVDALPKSTLGKVLKSELRQQYGKVVLTSE